jgi:hypothetical protein
MARRTTRRSLGEAVGLMVFIPLLQAKSNVCTMAHGDERTGRVGEEYI